MDIDYLRRRRRRLDVGDPTLTFHQLFAGASTLAGAALEGPTVGWTRDTISGMGVNSSGVGFTVASGQGPVFDHDPANSNKPLGVGMWKGVSQLCLQTSVFKTTWAATTTTITDDAATALDGTTTADDLKHTGSGGLVLQDITVDANSVHCFSVVIQSGTTGTHDFVHITYRDASNANGVELWANLTNSGAITNAQVLGTGTTLTASGVTDQGGGKFRIWIAGQLASAVTTGRIVVQNTTTDGGSTAEETNSVIYSDAQLIESNFPLPVIAATTASVDTDTDLASTSDVTWHSGAAGSWYVEFNIPIDNVATRNIVQIDDGSASNKETLRVASNGEQKTEIRGGANEGNVNTSDTKIVNGVAHKLGLGIETDNLSLIANGSDEGNDSAIDYPVSMTTLRLGTRSTNNFGLNGHIAEVRYYNVRKTDEFLQVLTA